MMKLQLSKGFHLELHHISRLLAQAKRLHEAGAFSPRRAAESMGFSLGKVKSLASCAAEMGILTPRTYLPTPLGELVMAHDAYFDDVGTLWLCHYHLASNPRCVVWQRMVNRVLPQLEGIAPDGAKAHFADLAAHFSAQSVKRHLSKELHVFFDTYTAQQFNRLRYLVEADGTFRLGQPAPVPDAVFAAAVVLFRARTEPGATVVDIPTLCVAENSVGRVFALRETAVREALERLHQRGILTIESRADLDQVRLPASADALDLMRGYYAGRWSKA